MPDTLRPQMRSSGSDRALLAGGAPRLPLRGRSQALARVLATLDAAASAGTQPSAPVLLRGSPGIGKTRLLAEAIADAERRGWCTITVTPDVDSAGVPLGALTEAALRGTPSLLSEADLRPVLAGGEPQYWVTRMLADALERAASDRGVLVVIDDLHWLDAASLVAVSSLIRSLRDHPVAWVLATRTGPARAALGRLVDEVIGNGGVVDLAPIDRDAVADLATDLLGSPPGPGIEAALERTGAIPLLVVELVRGLREEHLLAPRAGRVDAIDQAVPARFGASSRERLAHVSPEALLLAQVGSLFGRRFRLADALRVLDRSAGAMAPALSELLAVEILADDGSSLAFVHDTLREAADATLSGSLRRLLQRDVVRVRLESGESASAVAAAVVASAEPGDETSFRLVREAALQLAGADAVEAATLGSAAIRLARHVPRFAGEAADLLPVLWAAGRGDEAEAAAADLAPYLQPEERARSLLAVARQQTESSFDRAITTCDEALAIADVSRATRTDLLAVRALSCANKADFAELERTLAEARAIADPTADGAALATVDATESVYEFNSNRFEHAVELIDSAVARVEASGQRSALWMPEGLWAAFMHSSMGEPATALRLVDDGLAAARAARSVNAEALWMMVRCRALYDAGRLEDARIQAETVLTLAEDLPLGDFAAATAGVVAFRVALHLGDGEALRAVRPIISDLAQGTSVTKAGRWTLALEAIDENRLDDAMALSEVSRASLGDPIPPMTTPSDFADDLTLADLLVRVGDTEGAALVVTRAARRAASNPSHSFARAIHDAVRGRVDGDTGALESAAAALRDAGRRPLVHAQVLEALERSGVDDRRSRTALEEALAVYESLGAVRDASRVLHRLRERGVRRRPRVTSNDEVLSTRERQVLDRLVTGATTQQIADALFISPHTVISHTRRIYAKLGVNSRRQLIERQRAAE
ncbi:AAA family ATPase [Microbacterium trichothecenolyticum]|uniref:ATP-binding protein n=1 Tax=Microbacterium trichothecenolyticum TaxID=69370 RepID=UPI001C6E46A7|nr:LuxR C-terminal-related transcriptional regulator [Microbacterium trichothecenolyticum]MBW9119566.1 AAA family ATPase [Microbacterium trichothecenolyticum]